MTYPHLSRAPIVEGLVDLQVKQREDFSLKDLSLLCERVKERYPVRKDLTTFQAELRISPDNTPSQTIASEAIGYRLERPDALFVVLARRDGFTVSRLKPYDDWENLITEAKPLWAHYLEVCKPQAITRVATRYINRIELPIERLDFDDYLKAPPNIPKGLPEVISQFLTRLVLLENKSGAEIAFLQALEAPNLATNKISVLMDIDIYKLVDLPTSSEEVWKLLDTFRDLKNRTFFSSITRKTLELLK
ncbi:MAG: TIGR04255 family protein [Betaproteobacteria bacterium]|nr:TIGR04255 family protein [Betaproteobacteria bacterium]